MSVHERRPRRTRLAPEARRRQILDAALAAFERGGYHGTHVDDVVREAGVARGTFYLYFDGKHEVFAALVDRMLAVFLEARPEGPATAMRSAGDAEAFLRASYRAVFETFVAHRRLLRLLFEEAVGLRKGFRERLDRHYREWHERVRGTLADLARVGAARSDVDAEVTAEALLGAVERLTRRYLLEGAPFDVGRLVDALVALEMRGIRP